MVTANLMQKPHTLTGTALSLHRPAQARAGRQPVLPVARQAHQQDEHSEPAQKPVALAATAALAACLVMGSALFPADAEAGPVVWPRGRLIRLQISSQGQQPPRGSTCAQLKRREAASLAACGRVSLQSWLLFSFAGPC